MDIAVIIHELLVEGGGERLCVSLARGLAQHGHDVTVYTCAYDRQNCYPDICKNLAVKDVGRGSLPQLRRPFFVRGYLDMVHLARSVDRAHEIWNPHHWPAQWGAVWLKNRLGGAVVWMCNDVPDFFAKSRQSQTPTAKMFAPLYRQYYLYDRKQNLGVDLTVLLSEWAGREFRAIYPIPTRILGSGADPQFFVRGRNRTHMRARFDYAEQDFVLLWLGIFMPHRRLEDAITAVSLLASSGIEVRLLLAGSDRSYPGYCDLLKAMARNLGVQHLVTFTGKVADEEICDFYAACDAFVFPNDQQTWGLVVLEAMACGCPVLVSKGSGVHEVLTDNVNAVLFPPRNPEALAAKIRLLITQPGLMAQVVRNGTHFARVTYNWEQYVNQVESVCRGLIGQEDPATLSLMSTGSHPSGKRSDSIDND
jgi:glycosyltransferase involved in cell wall biosynthesis